MAADSRTDELDAASAMLHRFSVLIEDGLTTRLSGWLSSGGAWHDFIKGLETAGYNPALLALGIAAICLIAIVATAAVASSIISRLKAKPFLSAAAWFAAALLVILASWILFLSLIGDSVLRRALLNCVVISAVATMICFPLTAGRRSIFRRWRRDLALAIGIAAGGLVVLACLRVWNAADPLRDLFATFAVSLPFTVLVAAAYLRHRRLVTRALSFGSKAGSLRRKLAAVWPWLVVAVVTFAFVFIQLDLTIGRPTRGGLLLLSLLLVLAGPHLDVAIERRSWQAVRSQGGELTGALWRTFRIVIASSILAVLAILWLLPILDVVGISRGTVLLKAAEILMLVLIIAFCWNWVAIMAARIRPRAPGDPQVATAVVGTRLTTVGPLLVGLTKAALLTLGALTVLVMLGINVWPLITGLSIFGLAIGLGSQTLVKDVVAGLFFLVDDAFRHGEYIETSGAKGTVERISLRSVSLRHPRGPVATIPFGQIGKIQNFSREWVIEKMLFRVALDTDVEAVRKLFKKIGQEVEADPELNADLLEPFKSQGIAALEEGTLVIRGKYKARAGRQFQIRKAILSKVRITLAENGIKLVPKPLHVPQMGG
ncbi:mechanosensitive ion channel family protein [Bosea sp. NBC_00550]|uniref:mechanosensitive ion channel family protein n=1 Tax=Bosea sp. NBC_00550 TaxID=2969621 RepID=UPI00222FB113|nr:mechanosensitive ion channel family protein [Bosea sp. NBC_00550]UZF92118.1 mechanosensitive ion channel family protein [Bosea sp. NBC_00550]